MGWPAAEDSDLRVVQSLQRGLAVLDFLAERSGPVRTSEIAQRFDIDKANASRLLNTLTDAGYAQRANDRRYVLGGKMRDHGRELEEVIQLRERTRSLLDGLVEASGECAHMAVLVGDKVWYIDKVSSPHALRVDHPVGALAPLHCTALGKAFLAFLPKVEAGVLARYTASTITDQERLAADLAATRQQGYAIDNEEFSPGVRCVAAPLRDGNGYMVAAVGLSGPTARIDLDWLADLGRLVRDRSAKITTAEAA
jgi:DNA-binding IclR family transcriptional regulator